MHCKIRRDRITGHLGEGKRGYPTPTCYNDSVQVMVDALLSL